MRNTIFLATALITLISCGGSRVRMQLDEIATYIEAAPDSALAVLEGIPSDWLRTRSLKAEHALLHSIALDKCYIDVTEDSLINVAVKWYKRHGSADEKLKSYYYQGRVYQNAGDDEAAMKSFTKAEKYSENAADHTTTGLLHQAKSVLYCNLYDIENALNSSCIAAESHLAVQDTIRYTGILNSIAAYNLMLGKTAEAEKNLEIIKQNKDRLSDMQISIFYSNLLHLLKFNDSAPVQYTEIICDYLDEINDPVLIDWIVLAQSYNAIGEYENADDALSKYRKTDSLYYENAAYHICNSHVAEMMGDYKKALESYIQYSNITDEADLDLFGSDARFVEERVETKEKMLIQRLWIIILLLGLVSIVLSALLIFGRIMRKKQEEKMKHHIEMEVLKDEKKKYKERYDHTVLETENLKRIIDNASLDLNVRNCVQDRLNVLNKYILAYVSGSFSEEAVNDLKGLMSDQRQFLDSTKMSFMIAHPNFINYLSIHGLNDFEIGCCCLYCIGFNGKEIMEYLDRKSFYNQSASIRRKLDVVKYETNLDKFLKEKMAELD